jgi:hypothetical protein
MPTQDAFRSVTAEVGLAISPLRAINSPERAVAFFRQLGYEVPAGAFGGALQTLAGQAAGLVSDVRALVDAHDDGETASAIVGLLAHVAATVDAVRQLLTEVQGGAGVAIPNIEELPRRLVDFLLLEYLNTQRATVHEILHLLGLIEHNESPAAGQPARVIDWDRLGQFFTDPGQIADDVYQWSTDFDTNLFLGRLEKVMRAALLPGGLYSQADTTRTILGNTATDLQELRFPLLQRGFSPETYAQFGITVSPAEVQGPKRKGIALLPYIMGAAEFDFPVCERGELVFEATADIKGVGVIVRPPLEVEGVLNLTGAFRAAVKIRQKPARAEEIILIGSPGGTRLAIQGLGINWFVHNPQGRLDLGVEGEVQALRLVIAPGEGDGFLATILSGVHVQAEANLAAGITLLSGFTFRGGANLAIDLPTHIDLGPIKINGLRLTLRPAGDRISLDAGAIFQFDLGPLKATVENVGITPSLEFREGNVGPANLDISFKPPNGVGLSVDAGVVKGGGYLFFDYDRGEYGGALELTFANFLSLKAIGLISTRMPDGSAGFSLIIIITVEFGTGIQLGFGFTLIGVGGILGLNRGVNMQPLIEGVRSGAVNNILFPRDIVANAPRILSDIRAIFPPELDVFVVGPLAKFGWGTPTLITLTMGIVVEIPPGNIAILGVLRVALPTEEAATLRLQVLFVGAIEFDKKRIYFFAGLFDSRILTIPIEGEMALLVAWGDDANFVVSVGGFHPAFSPPPMPVPVPRRLAIILINTPVARVRVEAYFAVTSNTVQFGARAELFFGIDAANVQGFIAFDALFQFSPFRFVITIAASFSLSVFGIGLFSVRIRGQLEGPTPWHVSGEGSISFFFFDVSADFDVTWGESRDTALPPIAVLPIFRAELQKKENWRALLPPGNNLLVTLRKLPESDTLVLHPVGVLRVAQRAVPLDLKLDKVGNQKPSDVNRLSLVVTGGGLARKSDANESFAPAQFQNYSDSEKLSRPAYTQQHAGLELSAGGSDTRSSRCIARVVRYEEVIIDNNYKRFVRRFFPFIATLFDFFVGGASVARSELSKAKRKQLQPFESVVGVAEETYTVAFQATNRAFSAETVSFSSEASARDFMQRELGRNPNLAETIHVIPSVERAA